VRGLLADELGIDPSEPLRRLHSSVLAQDPALDGPGARPLAAGHDAAAGILEGPSPAAPPVRLLAGRAGLDWARRRGRRLLAIGLALAVAAAACIVIVSRPWA